MIIFWSEKNQTIFRPSKVPTITIFRESDFYCNSLKLPHKHHHRGGEATCPSSGVDLMIPHRPSVGVRRLNHFNRFNYLR